MGIEAEFSNDISIAIFDWSKHYESPSMNTITDKFKKSQIQQYSSVETINNINAHTKIE